MGKDKPEKQKSKDKSKQKDKDKAKDKESKQSTSSNTTTSIKKPWNVLVIDSDDKDWYAMFEGKTTRSGRPIVVERVRSCISIFEIWRP